MTKTRNKIILTILLVFTLVVAIIPSLSGSQTMSSAGFGFCDTLGSGMTGKDSVSSEVVAPAAKGRKWTVQELFGNSLRYSSYSGEGEGNFFLADTDPDIGKDTPGWNDNKVQEEVTAVRSIPKCLGNGLNTSIPKVFITLSSLAVYISNMMTTKMFSSGFICTTPGGGEAGCIDLLGIVGGTGSNEGIIGSLRTSVFTPFAVMAFMSVAAWLAYNGLIKKQFRMSFSGLAWSLAIFMIGGILMFNPQLLASIPQKANSTISTCIVGAMNGQSCVSGDVTAPSTLVGEECRSTASSVGMEGAAMATNSMNCSVWKTFVLDSWSRSQFGRPYNSLYLKDAPEGGTIWQYAPDNVDRYGVSLTSGLAAKDYKNSTVYTSGDEIYNLALYQLYIGTDMHSKNDEFFNNKSKDKRWYNIIVPATQDKRMWRYWAPTGMAAIGRTTIAASSMIVAFVVSISLSIFAFWGMVYQFAGAILMTFAPLFFLVGIHPGRGRLIFLGWVESVVSSILKFMASSMLVIVALTLYSSILSSTDGYMSAFIGILIMVGVLGMYRKEIINLLGMSNLGGQKMSNAVGNKISKDAEKAKKTATHVTGSAVGGALAATRLEEANAKDILSGATHGGKEGLRREMSKGSGFVAGATRQHHAVQKEIDKENQDRRKNSIPEEEFNRDRENYKAQPKNPPTKPTEPTDPTDPPINPNGDNGGSGEKETPINFDWNPDIDEEKTTSTETEPVEFNVDDVPDEFKSPRETGGTSEPPITPNVEPPETLKTERPTRQEEPIVQNEREINPPNREELTTPEITDSHIDDVVERTKRENPIDPRESREITREPNLKETPQREQDGNKELPRLDDFETKGKPEITETELPPIESLSRNDKKTSQRNESVTNTRNVTERENHEVIDNGEIVSQTSRVTERNESTTQNDTSHDFRENPNTRNSPQRETPQLRDNPQPRETPQPRNSNRDKGTPNRSVGQERSGSSEFNEKRDIDLPKLD